MKDLTLRLKSLKSTKKYFILTVVLASLGIISWKYFEDKKTNEHLTALYYEEIQVQNSDRAAQESAKSVTKKIEEFEKSLIKPTEAIKAREVLITPLRINSTGKEIKTYRASDISKLRITLKTFNNSHIRIGMHDIYLRVMDRNNNIMGSNESKKIIVVDDHLQYTHKATINFTNKNQLYTIDWINTENFSKGIYYLTLHADGYFMGRGSIVLQ